MAWGKAGTPAPVPQGATSSWINSGMPRRDSLLLPRRATIPVRNCATFSSRLMRDSRSATRSSRGAMRVGTGVVIAWVSRAQRPMMTAQRRRTRSPTRCGHIVGVVSDPRSLGCGILRIIALPIIGTDRSGWKPDDHFQDARAAGARLAAQSRVGVRRGRLRPLAAVSAARGTREDSRGGARQGDRASARCVVDGACRGGRAASGAVGDARQGAGGARCARERSARERRSRGWRARARHAPLDAGIAARARARGPGPGRLQLRAMRIGGHLSR